MLIVYLSNKVYYFIYYVDSERSGKFISFTMIYFFSMSEDKILPEIML